ncbi:MAG TPA: Pls/PosA family non-ribosomal peptide synthetase, partial [Kribbella sp.]
SQFFDELGANSLLMAQFSARLRKEASLPKLSMREIYLNPTVRQLAAALGELTPSTSRPNPTVVKPIARGSSLGYVCTGLAQLLFFLAAAYLAAWVFKTGFNWTLAAGPDRLEIVRRAAVFTSVTFFALVLMPILVKWLLVGDWKSSRIRLWSLGYLRFWVVKVLMQTNPMVAFAGSPLFTVYLRLLGMRVGRGVTIHSRSVPVATDLITVGEGAVIRKDCSFTGYRAIDGVIEIGSISVGRYAHVGEKTVLGINTRMGDGAELGHSSALQSGQAVPPGQTWHGCPAEPAPTDYRTCPPARCGPLRKITYSAIQLVSMLLGGTLGLAAAAVAVTEIPALNGLLAAGSTTLTNSSFYLTVAVTSWGLFLGGTVSGLLVAFTVPRLLHLLIIRGKVYPLYGFHHVVQGVITSMTNVQFFMDLFGDSSAVVHYLRALGYKLGRIIQSGSNFGAELRHDSPYLTTIGTGTTVSDALSVMNADYSGSSFRVSQVTIGERNFLGNYVAFPSQARTGDNVLLATKVMVPIDGPIRENVGLLGSPPFEIPRSVERDSQSDPLKDPAVFRRRLSAKNRHNTVTAGLFLLVRWIQLLIATLAVALALDFYAEYGEWAVLAAGLATLLLVQATAVLAERAARGFRRLTPQFCSIYDRYFWTHERLWKLLATPVYNGTPFKNVLWRLLGVRIGRRVFDDGCSIPEKTLVSIGDDAILNAGCIIQCHSLEDGSFKSGYTSIGAGSTLGVHAFVHYGVTVAEGSVLDADAFLMKGEQVNAHEWWQGNPAKQISTPASILAVQPGAPDQQITLPPSEPPTTLIQVLRPGTPDQPSSAAPWSTPSHQVPGSRASQPWRGKELAAAASFISSPARDRVLGVDVAWGVALLGLMAVHVFPSFDPTGAPTAATGIAGDRSAATFVLLAGLTLTFLSGGRHVVRGRARVAASAGIAVRAVLIGAVGLALGYADEPAVILPYYAALFLLALPMLSLRRQALAGLAAVALVAAPIVLARTFEAGLQSVPATANPTFTTLLHDPLGLGMQLLVTGSYPIIAYLTYLWAGLAIGKLDLRSVRVARLLFGGGLALAMTAWLTSWVLMSRLGGLTKLDEAAGAQRGLGRVLNVMLWGPGPTSLPNWSGLVLPVAHSHSSLDLLHTLGSAIAVLGLALLVCRIQFLARALRPLAAAGSMTLTLYWAHLIVLSAGALADRPGLLYFALVVGALLLAAPLRLILGRGPLEWLVSVAAGWARWMVATWPPRGEPAEYGRGHDNAQGFTGRAAFALQLAPASRVDTYQMVPVADTPPTRTSTPSTQPLSTQPRPPQAVLSQTEGNRRHASGGYDAPALLDRIDELEEILRQFRERHRPIGRDEPSGKDQ